ETRIVQGQREGILPINACSNRLRRLPVGEVLDKLHDRHQRQPPGFEGGFSSVWIQGGKILVSIERSEFIVALKVEIALGKGRSGNAGGELGNGFNRLRTQGHGRFSWTARLPPFYPT